jgi:hypothetical protein
MQSYRKQNHGRTELCGENQDHCAPDQKTRGHTLLPMMILSCHDSVGRLHSHKKSSRLAKKLVAGHRTQRKRVVMRVSDAGERIPMPIDLQASLFVPFVFFVAKAIAAFRSKETL